MNIAEGQTCRPNIGAAGIKRRRLVGVVGLLFAVALLGLTVWAEAPWFLRALVALPAGIAAVGFLQASRRTCIAHAATGKVEAENFSTTPATQDHLKESRLVASTIRRDALLVVAATAVVSASTVWLR